MYAFYFNTTEVWSLSDFWQNSDGVRRFVLKGNESNFKQRKKNMTRLSKLFSHELVVWVRVHGNFRHKNHESSVFFICLIPLFLRVNVCFLQFDFIWWNFPITFCGWFTVICLHVSERRVESLSKFVTNLSLATYRFRAAASRLSFRCCRCFSLSDELFKNLSHITSRLLLESKKIVVNKSFL